MGLGDGRRLGHRTVLRLEARGLGLQAGAGGRRPEPLEAVKAELLAAGCAGVFVTTCDLARVESAEALHAALTAAGIEPDVVINNAGMFSYCDILATPVERIERMVLLHDLTNTKLCRLFAADMIRRGVQGRILNMSSYSQWMPFSGAGAVQSPRKPTCGSSRSASPRRCTSTESASRRFVRQASPPTSTACRPAGSESACGSEP